MYYDFVVKIYFYVNISVELFRKILDFGCVFGNISYDCKFFII